MAISVAEQGKQWVQAMPFLSELLRSEGLTLEVFCSSAVISAYEKGKQWERAVLMAR